MGWIELSEKYPPQGLDVLVEISGNIYGANYAGVIDHDFYIGTWLIPVGQSEGIWDIESEHEICNLRVHAWMPLPKHFQKKALFVDGEDDQMEHPMFEDEPEWLYKGDCVYEQMSLEDFLRGDEK